MQTEGTSFFPSTGKIVENGDAEERARDRGLDISEKLREIKNNESTRIEKRGIEQS